MKMTVNRYIYLLFVGWLMLLPNSLVSTEYVPVYIWESSNPHEIVPALPRISEETFKEIIQQKLDKKSFIVIFAEPNLSSEDFGTLDNSGKKVYSQLANLKATTIYLPSVENPISVLKNIYDNDVSQTTIKDFNLENIKSSVLIVDLDDVQDNEARNEILQRHDKSVYNIYKALEEKKGDVFAIYTAYHTSWITPEEVDLNRQARNILQATTKDDEDTDDTRQLFLTDYFLLFVNNTPVLTVQSIPTNLNDHTTTSTLTDNSTLTVDISKESQYGITLIFGFTDGYWTLTNMALINPIDNSNESQFRVRDIYAPEEFSYQCNSPVFYQLNNTNTNLTLPGMQIQPFREQSTNRTFGDPYYCVGFMTAPIWSGIFVMAILATIMAIGLSMMMDIRTMDRFDDPKGKTIQINVSE